MNPGKRVLSWYWENAVVEIDQKGRFYIRKSGNSENGEVLSKFRHYHMSNKNIRNTSTSFYLQHAFH